MSTYDWFERHLNQHNVIHIMLNEQPDECTTYAQYISRIKRRILTLAQDTETMLEILQFAHNTEAPLLSYSDEAELTEVSRKAGRETGVYRKDSCCWYRLL